MDYLAEVKKPKYLTDELLQAMDMIAQARDSELSFDKTIIAEIIKLNNAETGEYFISYQQSTFKAYTAIGDKSVYKEGTNVYVKIPGGDFSAKKIIEGKAYSTNMQEEEFDLLEDSLIDMGECYTSNLKEYSILANAPIENENYKKVIYESTTKSDITFQSLFSLYPIIKISADFRTAFYGNPIAGNYGLEVEFFTENNGIYTLRLDITNFVGNLHEYTDYSPQYAVYHINNVKLTNLKKITFFQEEYTDYDKITNYENEVIYINDNTPNLFVSNIKISFVNQMDKTDSDYYCGISAPQGLSLIQESDIIELKGVLYYKTENILSTSNCQCYWFEQNAAVVAGHSLYTQLGGPGWAQITNPNQINFNILTIKGSDVYQQKRIKFVVVYNDLLSFSDEKKIVKYYNNRYVVNKINNDTGVYLELRSRDADDIYNKADWYVNLNGTYYKFASQEQKINITQFMNESIVYFNLAIPIEENRIIQYDFTLDNTTINSDVRITFRGADSFFYNRSGDLIQTNLNEENILIPTITTNAITKIKKITWYGPNGMQLDENKTNSQYSMIKDAYLDSNGHIHFFADSKYDRNKTSNNFQLQIDTMSGQTYYFTKPIAFIKEGNQQATGLTYAMKIQYCDKEGTVINKIPLIYQNNKWNQIYIKVSIMANGEEIQSEQKIEDNKKYNIVINCQGVNINVEQQNNGLIKITGLHLNEEGQYFLQLKTIIKIIDENNVEEFSQSINHYEPILMAHGNAFDYSKLQIVDLPTIITYNANGTGPIYINTPLSVVYKGQSQINFQSMNKNISIIKKDDNYYIKPIMKYNGAVFNNEKLQSSMGAVKIPLSGIKNNYLIQPIVMILENNNIADYDGTAIIVPSDHEDIAINVIAGAVAKPPWEANRPSLLSQSMVIAEQIGKAIMGLFSYDKDGNPSNVLKSDGSFSLGGGLFTLSINEQGIRTVSFNEEFIAELKRALGLDEEE